MYIFFMMFCFSFFRIRREGLKNFAQAGARHGMAMGKAYVIKNAYTNIVQHVCTIIICAVSCTKNTVKV